MTARARLARLPAGADGRRRSAAVLSIALTLVTAVASAAAEAKRLALVIGNDTYQSATPLHNARSDAEAVARTLKSVGFDVTLRKDVTLKQLKEALRTFKAQISGGDEAVFYYSGHGVQFEGTNYLIPTDLSPQNQEQVADESVPLQRVLDDLHDQKARFALAIVDACRDNPFKSTGRAIGGRGLAPVTAATGEMVLYSAGAGQEALDRLGPSDSSPNGVFTRVLIREIAKPGVPADQVLRSVRDQVVRLAKGVNHEQVPALYDQSIGEFYFVPKGSAAPVPPRPAPSDDALHVQSADELEQSFWNRIKDSNDPADFKDYKAQYPKGPHVGEAALMLRRLDHSARKREAAVTPASEGTAVPVRENSAAPARSASAASVVPGTYGGYVTSSLQPGTMLRGRIVLSSNGDFEYTGSNHIKVSGNLNLSNPDSVEGKATVTQPKVLGMPLARYPDGSTSAHMVIRGRMAGGVLQGRYSDAYETGELVFDLGHPF